MLEAPASASTPAEDDGSIEAFDTEDENDLKDWLEFQDDEKRRLFGLLPDPAGLSKQNYQRTDDGGVFRVKNDSSKSIVVIVTTDPDALYLQGASAGTEDATYTTMSLNPSATAQVLPVPTVSGTVAGTLERQTQSTTTTTLTLAPSPGKVSQLDQYEELAAGTADFVNLQFAKGTHRYLTLLFDYSMETRQCSVIFMKKSITINQKYKFTDQHLQSSLTTVARLAGSLNNCLPVQMRQA